MEVRRQRVLRQVHGEVAGEHGGEAALRAEGAGQHLEQRDGEHEAGAERHQHVQRAGTAPHAGGDENAAHQVGQPGDRGVEGSLDQLSNSRRTISSSASRVLSSGRSVTRSSRSRRICP